MASAETRRDNEKAEAPVEGSGGTNNKTEQTDQEEKEGVRLTHLREVLGKIVKKCISGFRLSTFKESFRPLYNHNSQAVKSINEQMILQLEANVSDEISRMFEEENIVALVNQVDDLKVFPEGWRPSGDPEVDLRSHLLPIQLKHCDQLAVTLKELESRNRMLQETVKSRQEKLHATKERVEELCAVWQEVEGTVPDETTKVLEDFVKTCGV